MCSFEARILFDPGASHSFVSLVFTSRMEWEPSKILFSLSVATCPVLVEGRELLAV